MRKIKIRTNTLGDTRTAKRVPTFPEFNSANVWHIEDVKDMMLSISEEIKERGRLHDFTKTAEPHRSIFYRELCATIEGKIDNFENAQWYPNHCICERHHLNKNCPNDVDLIDVIEMICDCVCAGMARTGEVRPIEISTDILQKAVNNTVTRLANNVEIIE